MLLCHRRPSGLKDTKSFLFSWNSVVYIPNYTQDF